MRLDFFLLETLARKQLVIMLILKGKKKKEKKKHMKERWLLGEAMYSDVLRQIYNSTP